MIKVQIRHTLPGNQPFELDVDLNIPVNGVTAVFGPSGSGKTTFLRCIAGLEKGAQSHVQVGDELWQSDRRFVPVHQRQMGYVFQEASLFSHLTARDNIQYAIKRASKPIPQGQLEDITRILGIQDILGRKPEGLSGGERQRVAIARAILSQPKILLMDEPLSSLDNERKEDVLPYLEDLHHTLDIPVLYVTHDLQEVTRLADHLVILERGKITHSGSVEQVATESGLFAKEKAQCSSLIDGQLTEFDEQWHLTRFVFEGGELWLSGVKAILPASCRLRIMARDISLSTTSQSNTSIVNHLKGHIVSIRDTAEPALQLVDIRCGEYNLVARVTRRSIHTLQLVAGMHIFAHIKAAAVVR